MNEQHNEARLVELETRLAYQEETLRVLGEALTAQQKRVEYLELVSKRLLERAASGEAVFKGAAADEVPPHY